MGEWLDEKVVTFLIGGGLAVSFGGVRYATQFLGMSAYVPVGPKPFAFSLTVWCQIIGWSMTLIGLMLGLVIAFGIAPNWMSREVDGKVENVFIQDSSGGVIDIEDSVPETLGRVYIRLDLGMETAVDFMGSRKMFLNIKEGELVRLRHVGRRCVGIVVLKEPQEQEHSTGPTG